MDSAPGVVTRTGRSLDLAIEGSGFFVVRTPRGVRYTRQGDFRIDEKGRLATMAGFPVLGDGGVIRLTRSDVSVDSTGAVSEGGSPVGKLRLVSFSDTTGLSYEGGVYRAGGRSRALPVKDGAVTVLQGFLEGSNVSPVREMASMMDNLRAYETQVKMVQAIDEMSKKAIEEVGRVA